MDELMCRVVKVFKKIEQFIFCPGQFEYLKKGKARAIRYFTLDDICKVLECQPEDILGWG